MKKISRIGALLLTCALLFSGCAGGNEESKASSSQSSESSESSESKTSSVKPESSKASESSESEESSEKPQSSESTQNSEPSESSQSTESSQAVSRPAPQVPSENPFFDDAVFIGDSVSLRLSMYCQSHPGALGNAQFLTAGSLGSGNALEKVSGSSIHPSYQGSKMLVEDGVKASGAKKVFIMLGMNDLGVYGVDGSVQNMQTLVGRILKKNPDAEIYLQSMTPMLTGRERKVLNNANLDKYNAKLKQLAAQNGYHFADVASVMKKSDGSLIPAYCSDPEGMGIHFTNAGAEAWIHYLTKNASSF